ncbi:MAG TPA: M20/M25/M40 family metallo-hydrolase [Gemmatimonadales bacterium]|nr:M20/M25/M40 family metallo-hydrolase [Gemmatimonadales bacterium]
MKQLVLIAALAFAAPLPAQTDAPSTIYQVDTTGVGRLIAEAMERSELMGNLAYLSDVIGPRLSGSAAMRRANEWTAGKFRAYGLEARLEEYPFGVTWERGPIQVRLTAPFHRWVTAHSWAWTAGTGGKPLAGPVVRVNLATPESLAVYRDKVKGAWVMLAEPALVRNPDGPAPTAADSAAWRAERERRAALAARLNADTSAAAARARQQFLADRPYFLKAAGALGTIVDGAKEHALMTMSGSPNRISPLPSFVVSHEDYLLFDRLIARGEIPRLEARIENRFGREPVPQWNTIGEIRGAELPNQVVIVGAHLDSWDLAQGVTDNGASSMAVLEAARVIARSGLRPKRTIRFILFSGEEQGLLGSRAYAAAHAAEADSVQAVLVLDNGTGMILGQALQGRDDLHQLWTELLAPVAHLGAGRVRQADKGGTDHLPFLPYGIPAFNFDQEPRGYNHTHHSQSDTFDKAIEGDLTQAAAVLAVTAYELANLPALLPRGPTSPVTPPITPSPALRTRFAVR